MAVPFLKDSELKHRADEFLGEYHPSRAIPVPIESIVESGMQIEIFPVPNLRRTADVDALTTSDISTICVDEYVMMERENRYRFSLAHEAGHAFLHAETIKTSRVKSIADWRSYIQNADDDEYARMEFQANRFAGLVLAPLEHLRRLWFEAVARVPLELQQERILERAYQYIATSIAPEFEMSPESVSICLACERLGWKQ